MKVLIITDDPEINWDKQQILIGIATGSIILSTGQHTKGGFQGYCICNKTNVPQDELFDEWSKYKFRLFKGKITLENN